MNTNWAWTNGQRFTGDSELVICHVRLSGANNKQKLTLALVNWWRANIPITSQYVVVVGLVQLDYYYYLEISLMLR